MPGPFSYTPTPGAMRPLIFAANWKMHVAPDEARAYLAHPVLGPRLRRCTDLVMAIEGRGIAAVLGSPDDAKFRSCMTLFARASGGEPRFQSALDRFFGGDPDAATLARL